MDFPTAEAETWHVDEIRSVSVTTEPILWSGKVWDTIWKQLSWYNMLNISNFGPL